MSTILTPSASLMIPQKWLLPLWDTQAIASFNWCEHAFKLLMKGISEFQKIPKAKESSSHLQDRQSYISGCILFLQLFYFDSVVSRQPKGGLLSIDIKVCKPGGSVCDGEGAAGQAVVDDELKQKVAELEAGLKECREQNADTSEKLGLILTMVQSISRNQQQPPQQQPDQRYVLPSTEQAPRKEENTRKDFQLPSTEKLEILIQGLTIF
ncbi:hypothetical protein ACLB2K_020198 [Fragaria x ananassa]